MSLRQTISETKLLAMKSHEEIKLGILRILWSAIRNLEIDKKRELTDEEVQSIVATLAKQLAEAVKDFIAGNRSDLVEKTEQELAVLKSYLPAQLSEEELTTIVKKIISENSISTLQEVGKATGLIMKEVKGRADGNRVRELVNKLLSV